MIMVSYCLLAMYSMIILTLLEGGVAKEYGSYHYSQPPFYYIRSNFSCISGNEKMVWETLVVEIHPGADDGCGFTVPRMQAPALWTSIDKCLNDEDYQSVEECSHDEEFGTVFQVNKTKILNNRNLTIPCVQGADVPEITAMHIIYSCRAVPSSESRLHDDIMTYAPSLPPIPPNSDSTTMPPPPSRPDPTMGVEPTELHTPGDGHVVVTPETTTNIVTTESTQNTRAESDSNENEDAESITKQSPSHPITYSELAVIVGPSVAIIALLIIILVAVVILVKRKNLKLPIDLQGESLFSSRRVSTASQLSDISVNGQQMRTVP